MKKILPLFIFLLFAPSFNAQVPTFTILSNTGSYSLTCSDPSLALTASVSTSATTSYSWVTGTSTLTGATQTISTPGSYTVMGMNSLGLFVTILNVGTNTLAPAVSPVSPPSQTINCGTAVGGVVTSTSQINSTHYFVSPYGGTVVSNQSVASYTPLGPGIYTHVTVNNINGCQSSSTFSMVTVQGFPTFNVSSAQNYTLGCGSKSVVTVAISNGSTSNPAGGPVSYTIMPLSETTPAPPGVLSTMNVFTITVPGIYYAIVRDNTSQCTTQIPFSVLANTLTPQLSVAVPNQVLSCDVSSVVLQGSSTNTNVSMVWSFVGQPGTSTSNTILAFSNSVTPTSTLVNNYTLTITDLHNLCKSSTVIPVYQNLFPPVAAISAGMPNPALSCLTPSIVLTNVSTSGIPASSIFPNTQPVIGFLWQGPTPLSLSSTYTAATTGIYTLVAKDLNNGCTSSTTITIGDNRIYPVLNATNPFTVACPGTVNIMPDVVGSTANLAYFWATPPGGAIGSTTMATLTTATPGPYTVTVTNTITGCSSQAVIVVYACVGLEKNKLNKAGFAIYPNPTKDLLRINTGTLAGAVDVEIYNTLGQIILKTVIHSSENTIDLGNEAKGVYIIHVLENKTPVYTTKIVKE